MAGALALPWLVPERLQGQDIDYYYTYRLQGQPAAGQSGIVTHSAEPRELRGGVTAHF